MLKFERHHHKLIKIFKFLYWSIFRIIPYASISKFYLANYIIAGLKVNDKLEASLAKV
jgi:hypothetical protein